MPKALICGISGQDGAYLARFLLEKGYDVAGTSRDAMATSFRNLVRLGIRDQVSTVSMAPSDFGSVLATIKKLLRMRFIILQGRVLLAYLLSNLVRPWKVSRWAQFSCLRQ